MTGTKYLSDTINLDSIQSGIINIIDAPTGAGKTTFILDTIAPQLEDRNKLLYLIDTVAGKEQLLKKEITEKYSDEWFYFIDKDYFAATLPANKVVVMTYAKFGVLACKSESFGMDFDYIVCDEFHNLFEFVNFSPYNRENYYLAAINRISSIGLTKGKTKIIALTATPQKVIEVYPINSNSQFVLSQDELDELRQYETETVERYNNLKYLLENISPNKKGIIYVQRISQLKQIQEVLSCRNIKSIALWSIHNKEHSMNEEQLRVRDFIIQNETIPDGVDVLLINASYETSINIKGELDYMVIHSQEEDIQTQVRGRYRNDLQTLYLYYNAAEVSIPNEFMGRKLYAEEKDKLCEILNIRNKNGRLLKWNSIKENLIFYGYTITEGRSNNKRYSIITQ